MVQESLTNVVRHAAAQRATVDIRAETGALVVVVHDDGVGAGASPSGGGFGLQGMRERVESLGGRLEAGPDPAGGWRVCAHIPFDRRRSR